MAFEGTPKPPSKQEMDPSDEKTLDAIRRSIEGLPDDQRVAVLKSHLGDFLEAERRRIEESPLPDEVEAHTIEAYDHRSKLLEETSGNTGTVLGALKQEVETLQNKMQAEERKAAEERQRIEKRKDLQARIGQLVLEKQHYKEALGLGESDEDAHSQGFDDRITDLSRELENL